jgi:prepilin-type N-terminal cleavage/methylation domain-containing protein
MRVRVARKSGFTLIEIMIVVAIIGLIAAIAIPSFRKARETARAKVCLENLYQIEAAKQQWALEKNGTTGAIPPDNEVFEFMKRTPECPGGFTYDVNAIGVEAACKSGLVSHHF